MKYEFNEAHMKYYRILDNIRKNKTLAICGYKVLNKFFPNLTQEQIDIIVLEYAQNYTKIKDKLNDTGE